MDTANIIQLMGSAIVFIIVTSQKETLHNVPNVSLVRIFRTRRKQSAFPPTECRC